MKLRSGRIKSDVLPPRRPYHRRVPRVPTPPPAINVAAIMQNQPRVVVRRLILPSPPRPPTPQSPRIPSPLMHAQSPLLAEAIQRASSSSSFSSFGSALSGDIIGMGGQVIPVNRDPGDLVDNLDVQPACQNQPLPADINLPIIRLSPVQGLQQDENSDNSSNVSIPSVQSYLEDDVFDTDTEYSTSDFVEVLDVVSGLSNFG